MRLYAAPLRPFGSLASGITLAAALVALGPRTLAQAPAPPTTTPARAATPSSPDADSPQQLAPLPAGTPIATATHAPAAGLPDYQTMTPAQLARIAAQRIDAVSRQMEHYTYFDSVRTQQIIDGTLVVDHTVVSESIFLGGLPYLRKVSVDGKPLEGKELFDEQKLYDDAVRERTSLDAETRARLDHRALRSPSHTDLSQLPTYFHLAMDGYLKVDGQDCLVLDATPMPELTNFPSVQRHILIYLEVPTLDVHEVHIEFLVDDQGFDRGTIIDTKYKAVNGVPLISERTLDAVVKFKELLGKPIKVHKVETFDRYRRFRATVTIEAAGDQPPPPPEPAQPAHQP